MATTTVEMYVKPRTSIMGTIRKTWRTWGGVSLVIAIILAILHLGVKLDGAKGLLQIWLVFNVLFATALILSSQTVRQARRWHGADWWLAMISGLILVLFIIIGIIPEYLAPYVYDVEAGPARLGPREVPANYILITRVELPYENFADIGYDINTGELIERTSNAKSIAAIDEKANRIVGQERDTAGIKVEINRDATGLQPIEALNILSTSDVTADRGRPLVAIVGEESQFKDLVSEYPNLRIVGTVGPAYKGGFLFGTNLLGQDVFSRLLYGTQNTLMIGISAAICSCLLGIPLGLISGYLGGILDRVLSLVMDSLYAFPGLVLAIAIAAVLGPGIGNIILAIAVIYVPTYFRLVRSQTLAIREVAYVEAAKSLGATNPIILIRYIFPNVIASVVVIFSINVADAILTGAGLAFLGLGLPETVPDWGVDLSKGSQFVLGGEWWLVTFPGLAIALLTLCFSMLGESLSEILNPRLNRA
ncbi:MAG: ABC transporter permease [Chloroflexi bacterium]|nr:ABC transporter permease [Chloroflexota bacterium]